MTTDARAKFEALTDEALEALWDSTALEDARVMAFGRKVAALAQSATIASAQAASAEPVAWSTPSDWQTLPLATSDPAIAAAWRRDSRKVTPLYTTPAPAAKPVETEAVAWRTSWAVLQRLRQAAQHPPSVIDHVNGKRAADDIWRTVLLSDLQELLAHTPVHAAKPAAVTDAMSFAATRAWAVTDEWVRGWEDCRAELATRTPKPQAERGIEVHMDREHGGLAFGPPPEPREAQEVEATVEQQILKRAVDSVRLFDRPTGIEATVERLMDMIRAFAVIYGGTGSCGDIQEAEKLRVEIGEALRAALAGRQP